MKTAFYAVIVLVLVFTSCNIGSSGNFSKASGDRDARIWETLQQEMAYGAGASDERPYPDVLSEKEILIKAVHYAELTGAFDPNYYLYQENPALLNAKIETPVLLHYVPSGDVGIYILTVVDTDGTSLLDVYVSSDVNTGMKDFERGRVGISSDREFSTRNMTKRDAVGLIESQFPGRQINGPIAVTGLDLEGSRYSNRFNFWYFTLADDRSRNSEEYIIAMSINGWKNIPGGMSNRRAISGGESGSYALGWNRMARLDTPLGLFDRSERGRSSGGSEHLGPSHAADIKFTPVPLK